MKKKSLYLILVIALSITITACGANNGDQDIQEELEAKNSIISSLEEENRQLEERISQLEAGQITNEDNLLAKAIGIMELVEQKDFENLSKNVHPSLGVRFSPYDYINLENDRVFSAAEVADLANNDTEYTWGSYDGSGDPINLSFQAYYDRFIYNNDFANPQIIGNNVSIGQGNTINNIEEAYANGQFVEFHFEGLEEEYAGMDWNSLKLVFEEHEGNWYIVGVVHGEWTI